MRTVFMGTPEFAVPSLRILHDNHDVIAVYTRPDAVSGRGGNTRPSPVATIAQELGIRLCKPRTLRDPDVQAQLTSFAPDVIVVAAYGLILPREVLEIPRLGCVNVHGSLLPRWRGAAPVQRAILAGDEMTGVCIMLMEEGLDTGPYCATESTPIGQKGSGELTRELASMGAALLERSLDAMARDECSWTPQDDTLATYADKITRANVALEPTLSAATAIRRVRASGPTAPCRISIAGKNVTAVLAVLGSRDLKAGMAEVTREGIELGASDGSVVLTRIKPDGKAEMDAAAWARGLRSTGPLTWGAAS